MSTGNLPVPDVDSVYLEKTLRHEPMELSLDDSVSVRTVIYLFLRAWIASILFFSVFMLLWLITGGASSAANNGFNGGGSSSGSGGGLLVVAFVGSALVFWGLLLLSRVKEPIGEWRVLLAERGQYSNSVYSAVAGVLATRRMPIRPQPRRIYADPANHLVKNVLVLKEGQYIAYVTVFPYGTSLYLGWMMWRSRFGAGLIWRMITDMIGSIFGASDIVRVMLRTDRPRAMREAVHAACREGVYTAVHQVTVPDNYGFPGGLPVVEAFELTSTVGPAVPPAPSAPVAPPHQ